MSRLRAIASVALLIALIGLLPPAAAHSRAGAVALSAAALSIGPGQHPASPGQAPAGVPIFDGLVITHSVTFEPGVYNVEDVAEDGLIFIAGDGITLDGSGVYINGLDFGGYGIVMNGHSGLTLRHFDIQGFLYAVRIQNAQEVLIESSSLSSNRKETTEFWLDININHGFYGGGILFEGVTSSTVQSNTLTNQSIGVELFGSDHNTIVGNTISSGPEGNEAGQNSCWGIRLHSSTFNLIQNNRADYVDRERYGLESGDAAGVLLVVGSDDNRVVGNSITHSGDGFFIGNEWGAPSNRNYVAGNDGSYSPHNAFETTFSDGNVFVDNVASYSDYGFWLGYSYNTRVTGNDIAGNASDGIAVDRGHDNELDHNRIAGNQSGIHLWDDGTPDSADYAIHHNWIAQNSVGVILYGTDAVSMTRNVIVDNLYDGVLVDSISAGVTLAYNDLVQPAGRAPAGRAVYDPGRAVGRAAPGYYPARYAGYAVYNNMSAGLDVAAARNWWGTVDPAEIDAAIFDHLDDPSKGVVHYAPFLTEPVSGTGVVVWPAEIAVVVAAGGVAPEGLSVRSYVTVPVTYTVAAGPAWLSASRPGGVLAPGEAQALTCVLDTAGLDTGFYTGAVTFTHTATGSPAIVPVSMLVAGEGCGPELGPWQETTPLPQPSSAPFENLRGQPLFFHGNYVYIFGGLNADSSALREVYYSAVRPDGTLGPWAQTADLPGDYLDHVEVGVGDYVYMLTGAAGAEQVYYAPINADGSLGDWTLTQPLSPGRQDFAAAAYGQRLYASGGNYGGTRDWVEVAEANPDGSLAAWTYTTALPEPIEAHAMVVHDGALYVVAPGGAVYYAPIEADGSVGNWGSTTPLPAPMSSHAAFAANGYLYALDGATPAVYYALIKADRTLTPWRATTWRPAARQAARVGAHDCFAYSMGGFDGSSYVDTVYYATLQTLPTRVDIAGPAQGFTRATYPFTATVSPPAASQPLLFYWEATGLPPVTHTGGVTDTARFAWLTPGSKAVTVTISNGAGRVWNHHWLAIDRRTAQIYLPLVVRAAFSPARRFTDTFVRTPRLAEQTGDFARKAGPSGFGPGRNRANLCPGLSRSERLFALPGGRRRRHSRRAPLSSGPGLLCLHSAPPDRHRHQP